MKKSCHMTQVPLEIEIPKRLKTDIVWKRLIDSRYIIHGLPISKNSWQNWIVQLFRETEVIAKKLDILLFLDWKEEIQFNYGKVLSLFTKIHASLLLLWTLAAYVNIFTTIATNLAIWLANLPF